MVVVATTLGNTLVELQLLCFGSFLAQGLDLLGIIKSLCGLLRLPYLPHGHTWFTLFQLSQTKSKFQLRSQCFESGKGSLARELKIFRV